MRTILDPTLIFFTGAKLEALQTSSNLEAVVLISGMINIGLHTDSYEIAQTLFAEWIFAARYAYDIHANDIHAKKGIYYTQEGPTGEFSIVRSIVPGARLVTTSGELGQDEFVIISDDLFCHAKNDTRYSNGIVRKIWLYGERQSVEAVKAAFDASLETFRASVIHWWYSKAGEGAGSTKVVLDAPPSFEPLMYPIKKLGGDPLGYMMRYFDSKASILFLLGPPGTGKTSLIRQFLYQNELNAYVTYDEKVLQNDAMFIAFLQGGNKYESEEMANLLVLEDVTEILQKRELEKNEMMARFLNVSDGLIQFPHKKMIFTTNLPSLKDVDQALLRPGRCYDIVEMRPLFYEEAVAACKAADLPIPLEKRDYFMSELYNQTFAAPEIPCIGYKTGLV